MFSIAKPYLLLMGLFLFVVAGCDKEDKQEMELMSGVPRLSTAPVTDIRDFTALSGGTIISDEGKTITASGICYSSTNQLPGITDDTTKVYVASGSFAGTMINLTASTTYYVRAYAINSAGTGYGNVISFTTTSSAPNNSPTATNILLRGNMRVNEPVAVRYIFSDNESDREGGTRFQWYVANDTLGSPLTPINGATDSIYTFRAADLGKYVKAGITPRAVTGVNSNVEFRSHWARIGSELPSITFTYNGNVVRYGIITSVVTGRQWLDRNLGAPFAATSINDWYNKGDLFQWGRKADGHQLINRAPTPQATTAVNSTTPTLSVTDDAANALFITPARQPFDWRTPQNANLWTATGGTNNVCPTGWHVPTMAEWAAEQLNSAGTAFSRLLITSGGIRQADGVIHSTNVAGIYWTSTLINDNSNTFTIANTITFSAAIGLSGYETQATGLSVRCIKD